jgi:phosphoglycerate dehydrogenase-like enzyme
VFPEEPYPRLAAAADLPGVWFTPHSAGFVRDLGARVSAEVADTLAAAVEGRPLPHEVRDTA